MLLVEIEGVMGQKMRWLAPAVLLTFLSVAGVTAGAADGSDRPRLRDGFVVALGSRLVGPVFTRIAFTNPAFEGWSGWSAVMDVTGDAGAVFDQYVSQGRARGYDVSFSDRSCTLESPGDVRCGSSGSVTPDTQFSISLRVCTSCDAPVSVLTLDFLSASGRSGRGKALGGAPPSPSPFALHLSGDERARQATVLPKIGEVIPFKPTEYEALDPASPLRVAIGTSAVLTWRQHCYGGGTTAVLRSERRVSEVFDRFRTQVDRQANEGAPTITRRRTTSADIASINGTYTTATVTGVRSGTWILVEECFGD